MSNSSLSKVISHEIGHLLGLNHSTSSSSGMTASVTGNSNSGLTQEDLENVIRNRNW
jgi:predicted Zn-dependent protease